jgi:hypothetical protein
MTEQNDTRTKATKVVGVSLYPEQVDYINRMSEASGIKNISVVLRVIINDYALRNPLESCEAQA